MDRIEDNNSDIYLKIQYMFLNLTISIFSTKDHYSPIMYNIIGRSQKLGKNRQQPGVTHGPLNSTSPTSHNHDKFIETIVVASK